MSDGFEAVLDDFKGEAAIWDGISEDLSRAVRVVGGLKIDNSAFGGRGDAASDSYESMRSVVESFLRGGMSETAKAADALRATRASYQAEEEAIVARANALVGRVDLIAP